MEIRPKWTNEELDAIFNKAAPFMGDVRIDAKKHYILRSAYGKAKHPLGWEVDHIKSIEDGGTNEFNNLRPLNIHDNRGRNN